MDANFLQTITALILFIGVLINYKIFSQNNFNSRPLLTIIIESIERPQIPALIFQVTYYNEGKNGFDNLISSYILFDDELNIISKGDEFAVGNYIAKKMNLTNRITCGNIFKTKNEISFFYMAFYASFIDIITKKKFTDIIVYKIVYKPISDPNKNDFEPIATELDKKNKIDLIMKTEFEPLPILTKIKNKIIFIMKTNVETLWKSRFSKSP